MHSTSCLPRSRCIDDTPHSRHSAGSSSTDGVAESPTKASKVTGVQVEPLSASFVLADQKVPKGASLIPPAPPLYIYTHTRARARAHSPTHHHQSLPPAGATVACAFFRQVRVSRKDKKSKGPPPSAAFENPAFERQSTTQSTSTSTDFRTRKATVVSLSRTDLAIPHAQPHPHATHAGRVAAVPYQTRLVRYLNIPAYLTTLS